MGLLARILDRKQRCLVSLTAVLFGPLHMRECLCCVLCVVQSYDAETSYLQESQHCYKLCYYCDGAKLRCIHILSAFSQALGLFLGFWALLWDGAKLLSRAEMPKDKKNAPCSPWNTMQNYDLNKNKTETLSVRVSVTLSKRFGFLLCKYANPVPF